MEIDRLIADDIASMFDTAASDDTLELEARVDRSESSLSRHGFERLVGYLSSNTQEYSTPSKTLDVSIGPYRATVVGDAAIGEMCTSDSEAESLKGLIASGYAHVIRKEPVRSRATLPEYNTLVSLKREMSIADTTDAIRAIAGPESRRMYRLKHRYSYMVRDHFRVDCTVVKSASGSRVHALSSSQETFEVEVEFCQDASPGKSDKRKAAHRLVEDMVSVVGEVLMVLRDQRSGRVLTSSSHQRILSEIKKLAAPEGGPGWHHRKIMPMPVTLERANLLPETADTPSVTGDQIRYTVTEKADGRRGLLFVDSLGDGYIVDESGVRVTDIRAPSASMSLLDGEHVTVSRTGAPMSLFLVFDVYFASGRDVRALPLVSLDSPGADNTRMGLLARDGLSHLLSANGNHSDPEVRAKEFAPVPSAASMYDRYKTDSEYSVDGLVLTPESLGVFQDKPGTPAAPKSRTWPRVFKWKPPKDNSIDFKVAYEKTSIGDMAFHDGGIRAKLMVGTKDVLGADPYSVLTGAPVDKKSMLVQFSAPGYGTVPDGSDAVGSLLHAGRDVPSCIHPPHDPVSDESIVEFAWNPASQSWSPLRVRHDKSFPNSYDTAIGVWRSICFPIESSDISDPSRVTDQGAGAKDDLYFNDVSSGDGSSSEAMRRFHRSWIIDKLLYSKSHSFLKKDNLRLLDIACGRGADMNSWIRNNFTIVVGVDSVESNLVSNNSSGAYSRLARLRTSRPNTFLRYAFVPMDASKRFRESVDSISNPSLKRIAQALWHAKTPPDSNLSAYEGLAIQPFDVVGCQFAAHYMFESEAKLDGFVSNVAEHLKEGGLFVGTLTDGDALDAALAASQDPVIQASDSNGNLIWRIERLFPASSSDTFGRPVAVYFETINKFNTEFVSKFDVLVDKLSAHGIRLLNKGELEAFGIPSSSALFSDVFSDTNWNSLSRSGRSAEASLALDISRMPDNIKSFSFLNRYFVFIKKDHH